MLKNSFSLNLQIYSHQRKEFFALFYLSKYLLFDPSFISKYHKSMTSRLLAPSPPLPLHFYSTTLHFFYMSFCSPIFRASASMDLNLKQDKDLIFMFINDDNKLYIFDKLHMNTFAMLVIPGWMFLSLNIFNLLFLHAEKWCF